MKKYLSVFFSLLLIVFCSGCQQQNVINKPDPIENCKQSIELLKTFSTALFLSWEDGLSGDDFFVAEGDIGLNVNKINELFHINASNDDLLRLFGEESVNGEKTVNLYVKINNRCWARYEKGREDCELLALLEYINGGSEKTGLNKHRYLDIVTNLEIVTVFYNEYIDKPLVEEIQKIESILASNGTQSIDSVTAALNEIKSTKALLENILSECKNQDNCVYNAAANCSKQKKIAQDSISKIEGIIADI